MQEKNQINPNPPQEKNQINPNKTKVISADLLEFDFDLDFNFYDIFRFCDISV